MNRLLIAALTGAAILSVLAAMLGHRESSAPSGGAALHPDVVTPARRGESGRVTHPNMSPAAEPLSPPPSDAAVDRIDASLAHYAVDKYEALLSGPLMRPVAEAQMRKALLEREALAVALNTARQQTAPKATPSLLAQRESSLAEAETRIRDMLHPSDYALFAALKDSDIEQFQLDDYAGGISNVAPLSTDNRRALLLTKLAYKQRFREILVASGFLRSDASAAERHAALASVTPALEEYRRNYLQEVRQYLYDDEQYALLMNYESSEFDAELAKLRFMAGG